MKRKDEDREDALTGATNNSKLNCNASPNISGNSSSNDANNANSGSTPGTVRTTGRVKKPKLVYDPSDNYISRGSRNLLTAPTPIATAVPAPAAASQPQSTSPAQSNSAVQQLQHAQSSSPSSQSQTSSNIADLTANITVKEEPTDVPVRTLSAEQQRNFDTCMKCGKSEPRRGSGYKSNYLTCKSCNIKWHFACLPITFEILTNARQKYKCEDCRRCCICMASKSSDVVKDFIMCCICVNAFHLDCHRPHLLRSKLNDAKWKCYNCDPTYNTVNTSVEGVDAAPIMQPRKSKAGRKKRVPCDAVAANGKKPANKQLVSKNGNAEDCSNGSGSNTSSSEVSMMIKLEEGTKSSEELANSTQLQTESTPALSSTAISLPTSPKSEENKKNGRRKGEDAVTIVPDINLQGVQKWSVDQVVTYVDKFYPRESNIFKMQEVDGAALMVLTRQDIIDRFGLKLGPALRLYELILSVQNSLDDVTLAWSN